MSSNISKLAAAAALLAQKTFGTSPKTSAAGYLKNIGLVLVGIPLIELASGTGEQILGVKVSLACIVIGLLLQAIGESIGSRAARDNAVSDEDAPALPKTKPQPPTSGGAPTDGHGSA